MHDLHSIPMLLLSILASANMVRPASASHPVVPGFERFYTGDKADRAAGGQLLLGELNCISCHQGGPAIIRKQAPILDGVANRVQIGYLKKYLGDPQAVKPGTTMPNLFHDDPDKVAKVEALVQFLSTTGSLKQAPPDIKSALIGRDLYSKIGCVACHGTRDLNGQPPMELPAYIVPLGDLKGKYSIASLAAFLDNPLATRPSGRMPHLLGFTDGGKKSGKDSLDLANYLLQGIQVKIPDDPSKKQPADDNAIELKPELVEKGKALFVSVGCANCHQLNVDQKPLVSTLKAMALDKLAPGGCLAEKPTKGVPGYDLSAGQRIAIESALKSAPPEPKEPAAVIARTMTAMNCYACHSRDKIGGPTDEMNKHFLTVQPEMGDEGRVPPPLDGVGAKLNVPYFKQILDKGAHDRPYMHTRMPGFGAANVEQLQPLFTSIDKVPAVGEVPFDQPEPRVLAAARHMVGEQALSCIKCHTFNGVKAEGIQGIDMTLMPKRINRDWFHYYMLDPQKYRPGTRMPSAFLNNVSPFPQVLDGKAATQIESMWAYLNQGKNAALPLGMGKKTIVLRPLSEAIIYRNFIQGAGARAIGVGYPEKANLAFDANGMRLAMIWQGAFIDAALHWEGRGQGFQGPLGDNIMAQPAGASFAVLAKPDDVWPTAAPKDLGYKFLGYRTTPDDRPTFDYSFNEIKIEDFPNPSLVGKDPSLKRTLKLSSATTVENLYFRAAAGKKIEAAGAGWFKIDNWKMKIDSASAPIVRTVDGKSELLVPVQFKDGKAEIVQEFVW